MSLFSDLGFSYSNDMFSAAMMRRGDRVGYLEAVRDDGTAYFRACENRSIGTIEPFDHTEIVSWDSFAYPTLGYRQDIATNLLAYVTRIPSTRRGFHFNEARVEIVPACNMLENSMGFLTITDRDVTTRHYSSLAEYKIPLVMSPVYTPFAQGIAQLMSGERPFFCTSPEFAVVPASERDGYDILYRQRVVGAVSPEGRVQLHFDSPIIHRLWSQEIERV